MTCWIELARDAIQLGRQELESRMASVAVNASPPIPLPGHAHVMQLDAPGNEDWIRTLACARRILVPIAQGSPEDLSETLKRTEHEGVTSAVRLWPGDHIPETLARTIGGGIAAGGGRIDLDDPDRTYLLLRVPGTEEFWLCRELAETDRHVLRHRRPGSLPFRKPVTLTPLLARTLVNLAAVPPGGRILDPFCGTGALSIEAGNLGYRVLASDKDGRMVRGTLRNLEHIGIVPEAISQCGVEKVVETFEGHLPVDGVVTDPPYGRASSTHGEEAAAVVENGFRTLQGALRASGRMVFMLPQRTDPAMFGNGWEEVYPPFPLHVHASLTRWVHVWRRTKG